MSRNKAIFLDRDGTINVDRAYVYKISDFEFIPGAVEVLKLLQDNGFQLIIITNQSGIARGYYTENDYKILNDWMINELRTVYGVNITASYFCPHHPNAVVPEYRLECNCRKPKLGLFERAIKEFDIRLEESFAIGDKLRDLEICERHAGIETSSLTEVAHSIDKEQNGCRGFLVGNKESEEVIRSVKAGEMENIRYCESLYEAAKRICCGYPYPSQP